jgi:hypothetical protein
MKFNNYKYRVGIGTATKLKELGWDLWTEIQYWPNEEEYTSLELETCALFEQMGKKFVYIPEIFQVYAYILDKWKPKDIGCVEKIKGKYFARLNSVLCSDSCDTYGKAFEILIQNLMDEIIEKGK